MVYHRFIKNLYLKLKRWKNKAFSTLSSKISSGSICKIIIYHRKNCMLWIVNRKLAMVIRNNPPKRHDTHCFWSLVYSRWEYNDSKKPEQMHFLYKAQKIWFTAGKRYWYTSQHHQFIMWGNTDVDICLKYTECIIPLYERRVSETGSLTRI